jgi:1-acyl-sn-glycerol-3-phosphate acyltransferase
MALSAFLSVERCRNNPGFNYIFKMPFHFIHLATMRGIKMLFWLLWRVWFYIMIALPILAMLPFLLLSIVSERSYPYFFALARIWGKFILFSTGFYYKVATMQALEPNKSYMIVANHTSMTDIMLMLAVIDRPFVFVGKKELASIPLFGFFYKRTCILVDRDNPESRRAVYESAQKRLNRGLSVCIFPEGGVPYDESIVLDKFKDGAFRLAIEHQIPIVPISFGDNKKRLSYTFFSGSPGLMRVKIHEHIETKGKTLDDRKVLKEEVYQIIYNQLVAFDS